MKCLTCPKMPCKIRAIDCPVNDWALSRKKNTKPAPAAVPGPVTADPPAAAQAQAENWQEKLTKEEKYHVYNATRGIGTIEAFKASRAAGLEKEAIYGCCLDCWRIANKLGIENTLPAESGINKSEGKNG